MSVVCPATFPSPRTDRRGGSCTLAGADAVCACCSLGAQRHFTPLLRSPEVVFDPDDVVFAQVIAGLDLDDLQRLDR